jgi:hypothetical protein
MGNKKKTSGVLTMKTEQIKAEFERNFTIELFGNRNIIRRDSEGVWAWIESQLQQAEKRGRVDEKVEDGLERFIRNERRICWEAEYQNGEFCIGENKVREFFNKLKQQLKGE